METSQLRSLYAVPGRFVTVYASTDPLRENAARLYEQRWQEILAELERQGVDEGARQALLAERGDARQREGGTRVVVVAGEGRSAHVPYARWLPGRSDPDLVAVGALPHLLPVLDWAQRRIPHVVALIDRLGVDVLAYTGLPVPSAGVSRDTTPAPWHKARAGGWAQRRYESHVEEHWKQGAKDDAELITHAARENAAEVVILAGDPKALALVLDELPGDVGPRVVVVQGSRARDGSDEHLADRVTAVLADVRARRTDHMLDEFHENRCRARALVGAARGVAPATGTTAMGSGGPGGAGAAAAAGPERLALDAADGPAATVEALRLARVSHLLLAEGVRADSPAWIGADVTEIALDPADLPGDGRPVRAELVDALIRAALGSGAEVRGVPANDPRSPADGVGALLRYALPVPG